MSIKAIAKVWEYEGIDPRNKFVLIAYADHADHDGYNVFPAVKTVAEKTCYSERTVQRATRELEEAGLLIPDGMGPQGTNRWRVNMSWGGDKLTPLEGGDKLTGVTTGRPGVTTLAPEPSLTVNNTTTVSTNVDTVAAGYACPDCGFPARSKGGLTNHRRAKHGTDNRHPAVRAYQEVSGCRPIQSVRNLIADTVGDGEREVAFWHDVVMAYCAQGWHKTNVANMLAFYRRGEMPVTKRGPPSEIQGEKDRMAYISGQYAAYIEH